MKRKQKNKPKIQKVILYLVMGLLFMTELSLKRIPVQAATPTVKLTEISRPSEIEELEKKDTGLIHYSSDWRVKTYYNFTITERSWVIFDNFYDAESWGWLDWEDGDMTHIFSNASMTREITPDSVRDIEGVEGGARCYYYLESGTYYLSCRVIDAAYGYFMPVSKLMTVSYELDEWESAAIITVHSDAIDSYKLEWTADKIGVEKINAQNTWKYTSLENSFEVTENGTYTVRLYSNLKEWSNYALSLSIDVTGITQREREVTLREIERPNEIEELEGEDIGLIHKGMITRNYKFTIAERGWVILDNLKELDPEDDCVTLYSNASMTTQVKRVSGEWLTEDESYRYGYYLDPGTYYLKCEAQATYGYFMPVADLMTVSYELDGWNSAAAITAHCDAITSYKLEWTADKIGVDQINTSNVWKYTSLENSFEVTDNGTYTIKLSSDLKEWKNYPLSLSIDVTGITQREREVTLAEIERPSKIGELESKDIGLIHKSMITRNYKFTIAERGWVILDTIKEFDPPECCATLYTNASMVTEVEYISGEWLIRDENYRYGYYLDPGTYYLKCEAEATYGYFMPVSELMTVSCKLDKWKSSATLTVDSDVFGICTLNWKTGKITVDKIKDSYSWNDSYVITGEENAYEVENNGTYTVRLSSDLEEWKNYPISLSINVTGVIKCNHDFSVYTKDAAGHIAKCRKCGKPATETKVSHTLDNGTVTKQPTTLKKGSMVYKCAVCSYKIKTVELPKLKSHAYHKVLTDTSTKAKYRVIVTADMGTPAVEYYKVPSNTSSVTIPAKVKIEGVNYLVKEVAANACKNNTKLKSVTIGTNVTYIGKSAFYGCSKLKTITISSKKLTGVGEKAIKNIDSKATIKVPKNKKSAYQKLFTSKTGFKKTMSIK